MFGGLSVGRRFPRRRIPHRFRWLNRSGPSSPQLHIIWVQLSRRMLGVGQPHSSNTYLRLGKAVPTCLGLTCGLFRQGCSARAQWGVNHDFSLVVDACKPPTRAKISAQAHSIRRSYAWSDCIVTTLRHLCSGYVHATSSSAQKQNPPRQLCYQKSIIHDI